MSGTSDVPEPGTGRPSVVLRVLRYLRPYRGRFVLAVGLVAFTAVLEIAKPWPLKIVIDSVLGEHPIEVFGGLGRKRPDSPSYGAAP